MVQQREESWAERLLHPAGFLDFAFPFLSYAAHFGLHGSCCSVRRSARPGPFPGCRHRPAGRRGGGGGVRRAPRERRPRDGPGRRRGTRPGAGGAAHRREATAAPQGSRRSIAGSGAGLAARRGRGGLATSAWAALGPAPAAARPAPVLPGRGSSRSRALLQIWLN